MSDIDEPEAPTDGRAARRERNVNAVLDVVIEMFAEEALFPTIEQAATRSGLSLRSVYRYFSDPSELLDAAIARSRSRASEAAHIHSIGEGTFESRVDEFVVMRVRLHELEGPSYRATVANAPRHPQIAEELSAARTGLRDQFERQFAPELRAHRGPVRKQILAAGDVMSQFDSIDYLRRHLEMPADEAEQTLRQALYLLLEV